MRRWRRWTSDETGSAALEFVTAGMILLLPITYLVLVMSAIQGGSFAVEGAARHAVRVFVQARTVAEARAEAQRAIDYTLADYGLEESAAAVSVTCSPRPSDCLRRLGQVTVTVQISVPLPLVPPALTLSTPLSIPLRGVSTEQVSRFWGGR